MKTKREWLIRLRKAKGLSRADVVNKVNITQQAYCYIENNKRNPSVELAQRIANLLGFDWTLFYVPANRKE